MAGAARGRGGWGAVLRARPRSRIPLAHLGPAASRRSAPGVGSGIRPCQRGGSTPLRAGIGGQGGSGAWLAARLNRTPGCQRPALWGGPWLGDTPGCCGMPRDAAGCPGMLRDAPGCCGMPRDAAGCLPPALDLPPCGDEARVGASSAAPAAASSIPAALPVPGLAARQKRLAEVICSGVLLRPQGRAVAAAGCSILNRIPHLPRLIHYGFPGRAVQPRLQV